MNTKPRYEKEDIVINFRDMLLHIVRRWRSILIGVLIVTLLAGGYRYMKDARVYKNKLAAENNQPTTVTLSEASLANANQVLQYQKTYQAHANYNRNSLLMQINPAAVDTQILSYMITGEKSYSIASMYQLHLNNLAMYETVAAEIAPDNDPAYITELVTVTLKYESNRTDSVDHVTLNIKTIAPTNDICAAIAKEIKTHMASLQPTVTAAFGTHGCSLIADTVQVNANTSLKSTQQSNLNTCNTLRNNLKVAKNALTSAEKAYVEQMTGVNTNLNNKKPVAPTPPSVSVKMLVLGFVAGLLLMTCVHALGYALNRKLKSREDFAERYGVFVFGCLNAQIDQDAIALAQKKLLLSVQAVADSNKTSTVYIIGADTDARARAPFETMKTAFADKGITLEALQSPLNDAAALDKVATADAVVLAETIGASSYDDIYSELDLCDRLGRPVLGAFILK